jgi:uridine kinase
MKQKKPEKVVIGLAGEMLSGKTSAANFIVSHFNAKQMRMSMILDEILNILDLEKSRENQQALVFMLRQLYGEEVLAAALVPAAKVSKHNILLIDGLRKIRELEILRQSIKNFILIYVKSSMDTRFERLKNRTEKQGENIKSLEEFRKSQQADSEVDISKLENYADFIINNDGTEVDLEDQLTSAFTKIIT